MYMLSLEKNVKMQWENICSEKEYAAQGSPNLGASPNLHFHTLPGTQIYTTHIYTEPIVTRHQIYTGPKFTRTHIFTTSNLHNPILHKPKYTQPQNNTKPNFTQKKFTQVPILHNQGMFFFSTKIEQGGVVKGQGSGQCPLDTDSYSQE